MGILNSKDDRILKLESDKEWLNEERMRLTAVVERIREVGIPHQSHSKFCPTQMYPKKTCDCWMEDLTNAMRKHPDEI